MAGSTTFIIPTISTGEDKNEIVERMKARQPLSQQEIQFAAGVYDMNMRSFIGSHVNLTPGYQDPVTQFDRLFINGVSVRSLCEQNQRTDNMDLVQKTNYMKAFFYTSALARDNVIEYCPPGTENSNDPAPQVRIDTRLSPHDLEQERPKPGFWRRIGEALRIIKPIPTPQEVYEERMRRDEEVGNDQERGALIKNAVVMRANSIHTEASLNRNRERTNVVEIQQEISVPVQQKDPEQEAVERIANERLATEKQLKDLQDSKKLFNVYFNVGTGSDLGHTDPTIQRDLTHIYEELQIHSGLKNGRRQPIGGEGNLTVDNGDAVADTIKRVSGLWTDVAMDANHPDGRALIITGVQSNAIMAGIDADINALNLKLNPQANIDLGEEVVSNQERGADVNRELTNVKEILQEEKGPEQKEQKIVEQKVVEMTPDERENAQRQLKNAQDTKKLFDDYLNVGPESKRKDADQTKKIDMTEMWEKLEVDSGQKGDTTKWGESKLAIDNPLAYFGVLTKVERYWDDVPKDEKHPEGKALMITGNQCANITQRLDKDINDLNLKLNPPEKVGAVLGKN